MSQVRCLRYAPPALRTACGATCAAACAAPAVSSTCAWARFKGRSASRSQEPPLSPRRVLRVSTSRDSRLQDFRFQVISSVGRTLRPVAQWTINSSAPVAVSGNAASSGSLASVRACRGSRAGQPIGPGASDQHIVHSSPWVRRRAGVGGLPSWGRRESPSPQGGPMGRNGSRICGRWRPNRCRGRCQRAPRQRLGWRRRRVGEALPDHLAHLRARRAGRRLLVAVRCSLSLVGEVGFVHGADLGVRRRTDLRIVDGAY